MLRAVDAPDQWRKRSQQEQQVRQYLSVVADRLETAEQERIAAIAAAHRVGLSVRQIAAAVRLSPARVHQLLHTTTSGMPVPSATAWAGGPPSAAPGSAVTLATTAALLRQCSGWLERLDRGELVAANLCEPTEPHTEYVPVERAQVRQVLQRMARDLEDLAAGSDAQREGRGLSRRERLADLELKQPRLGPREERAQIRRQLGLDP